MSKANGLFETLKLEISNIKKNVYQTGKFYIYFQNSAQDSGWVCYTPVNHPS